MFETMTFEFLLNRMLNTVSNEVDKREGSIIYDALAPAAAELAQAYIEMDVLLNETFADTASREYLIRKCADRGISPIDATHTVVKAVFNINIPLKSRFSYDGLNFIAIEKIEECTFKLQCETSGKITNSTGTITPIEYIEGLQSAQIIEVLIEGEDEEDTEALRKRYFDSLKYTSFGGNISDYKQKTKDIAGVGAVKVYPVWNGRGTVKLSLLDSNFNKPTNEFISEVQEIMDPLSEQGKGKGIAPINHFVTVVGATESVINISTSITLQSDYEQIDVENAIKSVIDEYLREKFYIFNANFDDRIFFVCKMYK